MDESELLLIQEKLAYLRVARPSVFGADIHDFRLNAPFPQTDILGFEQKYSVQLPADFRKFISEIGNGGAGPFYGVFPLGIVDHNNGFREWHEADDLVGIPSEPFPFEEEWNDISNMPPPDLLEQNEAEYWNRMKDFEHAYWNSTLVNGAIPICHEGCAIRILLVLTGRLAGSLWEDRRSEYKGLRPVLLADGSPANFGRWYREWLDTCLSAERIR